MSCDCVVEQAQSTGVRERGLAIRQKSVWSHRLAGTNWLRINKTICVKTVWWHRLAKTICMRVCGRTASLGQAVRESVWSHDHGETSSMEKFCILNLYLYPCQHVLICPYLCLYIDISIYTYLHIYLSKPKSIYIDTHLYLCLYLISISISISV